MTPRQIKQLESENIKLRELVRDCLEELCKHCGNDALPIYERAHRLMNATCRLDNMAGKE